jgi:hypothetical protein
MTTETIKPKYDSDYDSKKAAEFIRFVVQILGEVLQGNKQLDLEQLPEFFEHSTDILLYTLGWLEGQGAAAKKSGDTRKFSAVKELTAGGRLLLTKRSARIDASWTLAEYAATHLELANALEELADYKGPEGV